MENEKVDRRLQVEEWINQGKTQSKEGIKGLVRRYGDQRGR